MTDEPRRETLIEHITGTFGELTATEKHAARVLLDNYPMAGLATAASFAAEAGVSAPTILRLVDKLGFNGYAQFQARLLGELEARLQSPLERANGPGLEESGAHFVHRYAAAAHDNLTSTVNHLPATEIEAVSQLLMDERRKIYLLGGRFSGALAQLFHAHLHAVRGNVQHVSGQSTAWPEHLIDMKRRDVVLVFDFRRYQKDIVGFAEDAARRGATVVLFTDQWRSPAAKVSRHVLSSRVETPSRWDSAVAPLMLVESIIAMVTDQRWDRVESRIKDLETLQTQLHRQSG
ncbi:MAG: MurR/RpiR family transcriptional regulator [Proteobacteria bacterium]|nr:MAG: MurR/RpiR family transcriptional regulator [Pseudomonadota bacterium]